MRTKCPFTRAEKSLFLAPLLVAVAAGGAFWWQGRNPETFLISRGVLSSQFSPDGRRLVVIFKDAGSLLPCGAIYDVASHDKICDLQTPSPYVKLQKPGWSPDGAQIVAGFVDGNVGLWNAKNGLLQKKWAYDATGNSPSFLPLVEFSHDGTQIVGNDAPATIFDAKTGFCSGRFPFSQPSGSGQFSDTQKLIALKSADNDFIEVRETRSNRSFWKRRLKSNNPLSPVGFGKVQWSQNDVLAFQEPQIRKWPLEPLKQLVLWDGKTRKFLPSPLGLNARQFWLNPTHNLVAVDASGDRKTLSFWNYRENRLYWQNRLQTPLRRLEWSPDGEHYALLAIEKGWHYFQIFNLNGEVEQQRALGRHQNSATQLNWSPDSLRVAIVQDDGIKIVSCYNADR